MAEVNGPRLDVVFCDDIRREDNGKVFLIGTYTDDLAVSTFPAEFPLSMWLRMTGVPTGPQALEIRLLVNKTQLLVAKTTIDLSDDAKKVQSFLGPIPISIKEAGEIEIEATLGDGTVLGRATLGVSQQYATAP